MINRLWEEMFLPLFGDVAQEAMHVLLPKVLCQVLVCAAGDLWEQAGLPLLQQLEDKRRRTQVPIDC